MKYIPLAGIGLFVWGLIILDWIYIVFGILMFAGGFIFDLFKKKGALADDKVFDTYKALHPLIRMIRTGLEETDADATTPKVKLAEGLFYLGMVDAAGQSADMDDAQFLSLFKATFADIDYDFDDSYQDKLMMYHQSIRTDESAYRAIMEGGQQFVKLIGGNHTSLLTVVPLIHKLAEDSNFPSTVNDL